MKFPHLQLLSYMLQIWETQLEDKKTKTLKPVIPIIFYHGLKAWKMNSFASYFGEIPTELMAHIPSFNYILTDVGRESMEKISNLETEKLVLTLLSFQQFRDTRRLLENMGLMLEKIESFESSQENESFVKMVLVYIFNYSKLNPKEMDELITFSQSRSIRKSKSTAQQLIDQGIKKGVEQGIETLIIKAYKKGKSTSLLADIFEMTIADIDLIIKKHDTNPEG